MLKAALIFLLLIESIYSYGFLLDFNIALKTSNSQILKDKLNNISDNTSPDYGKFLSVEEIKRLSISDNHTRQPVINWLNSNNITLLRDNGDSFYCRGNSSHIDRALKTDLHQIMVGHKKIHRSTKDYIIPKELKDSVLFMEGLSGKYYERSKVKPRFNVHTVDNNYSGKEVVDKAYNISISNTTSYSTSICSLEYQDNGGFSPDDLQLAENLNSVPDNSVDKIIGRDTGTDTESQLDIQMMGINVPDADLWFWTNNNWLYSMAIDLVYSNDVPDVVSMSWGWAEDQQCTVAVCDKETSKQYIDRVNLEYVKLGLRGVTIVVSSGDAGAPGRTNEACTNSNSPVNAVYPGSSPYVTSVGATYFKSSTKKVDTWKTPLCKKYACASGDDEYVTNFNDTGWTSGGGVSKMTNRSNVAKWQDSMVTDYIQSGIPLPKNINMVGRAYPDVSLIGHSCPTVDGGELTAVDGTSCSSPIFASIVALLNYHQQKMGKSRLGFINPILYKMASDEPNIFNDISIGNNWCTEQECCDSRPDGGSDFGYLAHKGYDPVYGLGTPNVGRMTEWLDKNT